MTYFFYNIINCKHILTKYYNQKHTYFYLGSYEKAMLEQKLMEQIIKIKIIKEERKV